MRADNSHENLLLQDGNAANYNRLTDGGAKAGFLKAVDDYFQVSERGSTLAVEVRSGCIAWMTMSYIMVVNPVILCRASTAGDPYPSDAVMTATAFSAAFGSLVLGAISNAPLGLMPGMGLNAYFAFGMCQTLGSTWQEALSCCFVSGLLLLLLALFGLCDWLVSSVLSEHLKKAITVAIGVFQALIGFQVMGLVVASPDTLLTLGDMSWSNEQLYLALAGFCMISAMLVGTEINGALLIGIWMMAVCAWCLGLQDPPSAVVSAPSFDTTLSLSFDGWRPGSPKLPGMIIGSLVLLFVALFDLAGVQYGLMGMAGLLQDGKVPRSGSVFALAGLASMVGALCGTSPVIIASESSAGIMEGAKTGLMAIVVAVLFFLSAFICPLLGAVPHVATAVPLVLIGSFMMSPCRTIDWDNLRVAIPSFLTVTVVPFTYSIHTGILAGILMDIFLSVMSAGRANKEDEPAQLPSPGLVAPKVSGGGLASPRPVMERRLSTPHMASAWAACNESKADDARQLLSKLGTASAGNAYQVVHTPSAVSEEERGREDALRRALEAYLAGC